MQSETWRGMRRVLAVRLDNLGDIVMLGPALRSLRNAMPRTEITLLCSPGGAAVAPLLPWVDEVMVHRAPWQDASGRMPMDPEGEQRLVAALRERAFDAAFVFTSFSQSPLPAAYACYLAGIPVRVGQPKDFGGSLLSHPVANAPVETHQVDRNLSLVEGMGLPVAGRHLELAVPADSADAADALLAEAGIGREAPFVAVAPGASCRARRYDSERFAAATRLVTQGTGLPAVVVGAEKDVSLGEAILREAGVERAVSVAGRTSAPELAAVVRRSSLVIANNSGPLHMADAFERPLVVLYSGTDLESQWRPRRSPAVLLRRETDCTPCYGFDCPYGHECLDVPPQEVAREAEHLLARRSQRQAAGAR